MSEPLTFDRQALFDLYTRWSASQSAEEIPGVITLDSQQPGPEMGIMACTHGNEPAGLAAFGWLLAHQDLLKRGRVHLILNNIQAAGRYFNEAEDLSFTAHYRFIDRDMNRLKPGWEHDGSYESERVKTLHPLLKRLDHVLDLHSTSAPSDPMLIEITPQGPMLPVPGVNLAIQNIVPHLNAPPLVALCNQAIAHVLETGSHEDREALIMAQKASLSLLSEADMWAHPLPEFSFTPEVYRIYETVVFPHDSYTLSTLVPHLGYLPQGTVLATSDTGDRSQWPAWVITRDAYAIMPPQRLKPVHFGSEFMYLAEKLTS